MTSGLKTKQALFYRTRGPHGAHLLTASVTEMLLMAKIYQNLKQNCLIPTRKW